MMSLVEVRTRRTSRTRVKETVVVMEIRERRLATNLMITTTVTLSEAGRALAVGEPIVEKTC